MKLCAYCAASEVLLRTGPRTVAPNVRYATQLNIARQLLLAARTFLLGTLARNSALLADLEQELAQAGGNPDDPTGSHWPYLPTTQIGLRRARTDLAS
jgi:hypothetical protein